MKKISFYIILLFLVSCNSNPYIKEECIGYKEITQTNKLKQGDTLPNFTMYTAKGSRISLNNLSKSSVYIFFKTKKSPLGEINDEILNEELRIHAKRNNIDLIIGLDIKIAKIYGVEIKDEKIEKSILLITNKEKVIQKIYENICEDEIINILKKEKNSP